MDSYFEAVIESREHTHWAHTKLFGYSSSISLLCVCFVVFFFVLSPCVHHVMPLPHMSQGTHTNTSRSTIYTYTNSYVDCGCLSKRLLAFRCENLFPSILSRLSFSGSSNDYDKYLSHAACYNDQPCVYARKRVAFRFTLCVCLLAQKFSKVSQK